MPRLASLVVLALLPTATADADVLRATREQPLFEASHTVDVRIADGVATYTVRRTFSNPGTRAEQVELRVDLPYGAAATGLRIRASDRWYAGELMERDRAAALYQEMTGMGTAAAKDPALLAWLWADVLSLQVFPVMPGTVSTVEYTLTAPTRYQNGRYVVSYPRTVLASASSDEAGAAEDARARPLATPVLTVHPAWGDARTPVVIDGKRVARDTPVVLLPPPRPAWLAALSPDPAASYIGSTITIPASPTTERPLTKVTLSLTIAHTYRGDLTVDLITPRGESVRVHEQGGAGANDLRGPFELEVPRGTPGAGTWRLVIGDHAALDAGSLDAWSLTLGTTPQPTVAAATDTPLFIPDAPETPTDGGVATIALAPPAIPVWQARLGRVLASTKHAFARLEVDVAPQLVPLPRRAQVVFVLDASISQDDAGIAAQLGVLRAYLAHVPDAEVELVVYRRRAARVFDRFVPVADLEAALAVARHRGALTPSNGSAIDEGARLAATALRTRRGPRRIVMLTDERIRSRLTEREALAALTTIAPDVIVHVVHGRLDPADPPTLTRATHAVLAALATRHHGIYAELGGLPADPKALVPVALELVRPTRIDQLVVPGFDLEADVLHEGDGLRLMHDTRGAPAPSTITLTGLVWSDPLRLTVAATPRFSAQTAAFVFGADAHGELSAAEQLTVARQGKAVSPVTSYLAIEPGVRPSVIGFEDMSEGFGTIGFGRYGTGAGGGGSGDVPPDLASLVDTGACVAQVRPRRAWSVTLSVETTSDEIVDVIAPAGPLAACLAEVVWTLRLSPAVFFHAQRTHTVTLAGPAAP